MHMSVLAEFYIHKALMHASHTVSAYCTNRPLYSTLCVARVIWTELRNIPTVGGTLFLDVGELSWGEVSI